MPIKRPRLVLFDYGETLAHEDDYRPEDGFAAILPHARHTHGLTAKRLHEAFAAAFLQMRTDCLAAGAEIPNMLKWRWLFESHDLEFDLPMQEIEEIFWDAAAPCSPTPGMPELLALMRDLGIPSGVISNMSFGGLSLRHRLNRLFPDHHFACVISSADYILRKPDARLFHLALKQCNCPAEDAWFAGDNPRMDVQGAADAGLFAIHYDKDLGCAYRKTQAAAENTPHLTIHDWSELTALLRSL